MTTPEYAKNSSTGSLFSEVIRLTRLHFDDDAPEYVTKFLKAHLQKPPESLTVDDLVSLIHWIKVLAAFLEEKEGSAEQYVTAILELVNSSLDT